MRDPVRERDAQILDAVSEELFSAALGGNKRTFIPIDEDVIERLDGQVVRIGVSLRPNGLAEMIVTKTR